MCLVIAFSLPSRAGLRDLLTVEIDGESIKLDTLAEAPEGPPPRRGWPLAIITHGSSGQGTPDSEVTPDDFAQWVRFFAARGYYAVAVSRRGYGASDGPNPQRDSTCIAPDVHGTLTDQADDLEAVAHILGLRPDVDADRVVAIGQSIGGATVLALNGRIPGLAAIINVAGGMFRFGPDAAAERFHVFDGCETYRDALVDAIGRFGASGDTPSLWIYGANDEWFDTELVGEMAARWSVPDAAPEPTVEILPAIEYAHTLFMRDEGPPTMRASIDGFLNEAGLPVQSWELGDALQRCVGAELRPRAARYLSDEHHRALAVSADGLELFGGHGYSSQSASVEEALADCAVGSGEGCRVLARGSVLMDEACPNPLDEPPR